MRKGLTGLITGGVCFTSVVGISLGLGYMMTEFDDSKYHYDDKIGEEYVTFHETNYPFRFGDNILRVKGPNGWTEYQYPEESDFELEKIINCQGNSCKEFTRNSELDEVFKAAKKDLLKYLAEIYKINTNKEI